MRGEPQILATLRTADGERVDITRHAAIRWRERCRPAKGVRAALDELVHGMARHAVVVAAAPAWVRERREERGERIEDAEEHETAAWLVLGDIAFPLMAAPGGRFVAATCLTRGGISDEARDYRARRRRGRSRVRKQVRAERGNDGSLSRQGAGARKRHRWDRDELL